MGAIFYELGEGARTMRLPWMCCWGGSVCARGGVLACGACTGRRGFAGVTLYEIKGMIVMSPLTLQPSTFSLQAIAHCD
jgi:hypothetical protein